MGSTARIREGDKSASSLYGVDNSLGSVHNLRVFIVGLPGGPRSIAQALSGSMHPAVKSQRALRWPRSGRLVPPTRRSGHRPVLDSDIGEAHREG